MIDEKSLPEPEDFYPVRRALLSVSDKSDLIPFARRLHDLGISLVSTGGTAKTLHEAGLPVTPVEEVTGFPEILDGRVKTLHPAIHGGVLARRNDEEDLGSLREHGIEPIDLVVVNLYPFEKAIEGKDVRLGFAIENIDIGGPTLVRATAKNFFFTGIVTSPADYGAVASELESNDARLSMGTRRRLAQKAFQHTAHYDAAISEYLHRGYDASGEISSSGAAPLCISAPLVQPLRYGENPHQQAALYGDGDRFFQKLHGKDLSFNNLIDLSAALYLIDEFRDSGPTCAILKHTNPCGAATAGTLAEAYEKAFATDRQSPFGGIVVVNRPLDRSTAEAIDAIFTELVVAPEFDEGVLDFLMKKKNRRLIQSLEPARSDRRPDVRSIAGGYLVQDRDPVLPAFEEFRASLNVVTERAPDEREWRDLDFAWRIVKHVKSNAIVYARNEATLGIGAGQMSRIDSSEIAVRKGKKSELDFSQAVVASDAFFPFADGLIEAAASGARAAIQPGGSIRDEEVIKSADEHGMAMVFTRKRHFRH